MNVLDLFSGIGGFSLGLDRAGMRTVAFCEIDPYCRAVLRKHWPDVPIYEDVRTLTAARLAADGIGPIDVICGGFPCQPFSKAGERRGQTDDRYLWPEYFRLIREIKPAWVFAENVVGIVSMGLDEVLSDLEGLGYAWRAFDIPAAGVKANHERRRIWIIAHADGERLQERQVQCGIQGTTGRDQNGENFTVDAWRAAEPALVRRFHGIPNRVDRIRALGNAVVPQIPEIIGRAIMSAHVA